MKLSRSSILVLIALTAAGCIGIIECRRLSEAHRRAEAAFAELYRAAQQAQEIIDLRATSQTVESRQRPTQDVIAQVNAVLAEIGVPGQQLKSLTPDSEGVAVGAGVGNDARLLQQSLRLVLESLSPQQVGAFLIQWRSSQQIWTPTRIELTHSRMPNQASDEGNRFDATILLAVLYVSDGATAGSTDLVGTESALALLEARP